MIKVTFAGIEYTCDTAVQGDTFVLLYNNGVITNSFFNVADFDSFQISGGEWTPYVEKTILMREVSFQGGLISFMDYENMETGSTIRMRMPTASENVTVGFSIDGETYDIVDSSCASLLGQAGLWTDETIAEFVVDKAHKQVFFVSATPGGGFIQYSGQPPAQRKKNTLYGKIVFDYT